MSENNQNQIIKSAKIVTKSVRLTPEMAEKFAAKLRAHKTKEADVMREFVRSYVAGETTIYIANGHAVDPQFLETLATAYSCLERDLLRVTEKLNNLSADWKIYIIRQHRAELDAVIVGLTAEVDSLRQGIRNMRLHAKALRRLDGKALQALWAWYKHLKKMDRQSLSSEQRTLLACLRYLGMPMVEATS